MRTSSWTPPWEMGECPSLGLVQEEITGTSKDLTRSWHQVTSVLVITTDDIDRLSDKIRDAKVELEEYYARQVLDRSKDQQPDPRAAAIKKGQIKKNEAVYSEREEALVPIHRGEEILECEKWGCGTWVKPRVAGPHS